MTHHGGPLLASGGFTWLDGAVLGVTVLLLAAMFVVVWFGIGGDK